MNRTDSSLSNSQGAGSQGANGTLDLSTLGTLPRDRDRALGSPSIRSPSIPGAEAGLSRERRTRERSAGPGSIGIMGGVLGGIAPVASPVARKKDGEASKEVWQGGRWRRGQAQESEDAAEKVSFEKVSPARRIDLILPFSCLAPVRFRIASIPSRR